MKKLMALIMMGLLSIGVLAGCETMGRGTGEVAEEAEEGAQEFEEGYEEGRRTD